MSASSLIEAVRVSDTLRGTESQEKHTAHDTKVGLAAYQTTLKYLAGHVQVEGIGADNCRLELAASPLLATVLLS